MTGHLSKRMRVAARLWIVVLVLASACGHRRSTPESATPASYEDLPALIGKQVTVRGTFSLRGKFGAYVLLDDQHGVYLVPKGSFTWGEPYSEMEGKVVEVTGTLRFFHSTAAQPAGQAVARPPDYFYFEAETAQVRVISSTDRQEANPSAGADPPATEGFDGAKAYEHVRRLVEIGPRPPGSDGIHRAQAYIISELKNFGCAVEEHDFHSSTPLGDAAMKNVVAKIPGTGSDIVLYSTHYDTLRMANFVGADDGGSGVGTMLELARVFCARKAKTAANVWIAFFDGEEAQGQWTDKNSVEWTDSNNTYGSREMAASMALSGDLKHLKAMILADMIGSANLKIKRDTGSTQWLTDLIWATAKRLGHGNVFVNETTTVGGDDHFSFIRRGVPGCDIIDFDIASTYWHTPEDTLDKVDARSLGIVGNVFVETLPALEKRFQREETRH